VYQVLHVSTPRAGIDQESTSAGPLQTIDGEHSDLHPWDASPRLTVGCGRPHPSAPPDCQ
jgi:hypothetical protein